MSNRPVYLMCAGVAPSGECLRGKGPPDRIVSDLAPSVSGSLPLWAAGLNLVVAAVLSQHKV